MLERGNGNEQHKFTFFLANRARARSRARARERTANWPHGDDYLVPSNRVMRFCSSLI